MTASFSRIGAIIRADFRIRFRRVSTVIVFLLLSAFAYLWIPSPSTGRTLIQINGQRAIYNSGAIGMGTASLGMIFVGLFGFYVISNAIRRDVITRCGVVAASTPMRSGEYLIGKFLGNLLFLATFVLGFMLSSMVMLLVRGEARIEPFIFIEQYLLLTPPAIVFVSAVAVLFESIRWLSGKLGDVLYFFLWMTVIGLVVGNEVSKGAINWARCLDFTGFGFMIDQMQRTLHTESVSIGASSFDPAKPTVVFPGLRLTSEWVVPRLISLVAPLALLPVAALFFHRFDPVRTKQISGKGRRNWIGKIQNLFKPLSRRAVKLLTFPGRGGSFLGSMWTDALLTLTLMPFAFVALVAITIASLFTPLAGLLPVVFAVLAVIVSDVATRDGRAGTVASLRAIPRLREHYVWWKFGSTLLLSLLLCAAPVLRIIPHGYPALAALLCGILLVASTATALGLLTANPKTFIVVFLTFWYVVVNDKGANPNLDFAGFYGRSTPNAIALYGAISVIAILAAHLFYRGRLARA
jgi:tetrahydromethanopterin S-methyltransferase subunit B